MPSPCDPARDALEPGETWGEEGAPLPGETVLIVEDDNDLRALIEGLLERAGYATHVSRCGEDALAAIGDDQPALVVLDVGLPGISGYEVCHELRSGLAGRVPILLVSGSRTDSLDRVAGLLLGADDYLVKPFHPDELVARVRALLRRSRPPDQAERRTLTPRELEVLHLLADGRSQQEIADDLLIRPKTVGTHIEHILEKLAVHSRAQAVAKAYRDGLLAIDA